LTAGASGPTALVEAARLSSYRLRRLPCIDGQQIRKFRKSAAVRRGEHRWQQPGDANKPRASEKVAAAERKPGRQAEPAQPQSKEAQIRALREQNARL
jgi:hypothetical protein